MAEAAVTQTPQVNFTQAAAAKVKQLIDEEGNSELKLRVYITGGGCSGFQYGFTFDEKVNPDDQMVEGEDGDGGKVLLLIDPLSFQYLMGAEIDYTEGIAGAQFIIRNPNAQTTCGCGSSFSV
jgi:iron-sulfur cluster insertion protein